MFFPVVRRRGFRIGLVACFVTALCFAEQLDAQATAAASATSMSESSVASSAASPSGPSVATQRSTDLQGIWDFTMRIGERTSPGFIALGPVENGWAGSITMYLTNTLAIRPFTVEGDSMRMVVASREGDVTFRARLSANGDTLQGIVDYHGGARLPMIALRRAQPATPRGAAAAPPTSRSSPAPAR